MKSRSHDETMAELYRSDPALALEVINGLLANGDEAVLRIVMRQLVLAHPPAPRRPTPNTP